MPLTKVRYIEKKGKLSKGKCLVLEDSLGYFSDLITVKTGDKINISKTREELVKYIKYWMGRPDFNDLRKEKLDFAIVIYLDSRRYKLQDCDNISKMVLDTLEKKKNPEAYLFEDDRQIVRLLLYKIEAEKSKEFETNQMIVSFRKHDPNKQMILEEISKV